MCRREGVPSRVDDKAEWVQTRRGGMATVIGMHFRSRIGNLLQVSISCSSECI